MTTVAVGSDVFVLKAAGGALDYYVQKCRAAQLVASWAADPTRLTDECARAKVLAALYHVESGCALNWASCTIPHRQQTS